jgi:protein phosphatase methylesterase 1
VFHCVSDPGLSTAYVLLHGAGHSALSWALAMVKHSPISNKPSENLEKIIKLISKSNQKSLQTRNCNSMSYDMRGHGESRVPNEETDFSSATLAADAVEVITTLYADKIPNINIVLVGHSMGGTIATRVAAGPVGDESAELQAKWNTLLPSIKALVVIDVVEGTAMESLPGMVDLLRSRPVRFNSLEEAIEWSVRAKIVRNPESAKVSIPPQLTEYSVDGSWIWRTDLLASESYWRGWFEGMSKRFLGCRAMKLLILAGTDRLDIDLTVAQMQGKYQLVVLPMCGHTIQEDVCFQDFIFPKVLVI